MSAHDTKIEWCDKTINPLKFDLPDQAHVVNLCVPKSAGCAKCYAAVITNRYEGVQYKQSVMDAATPVLVEKELQWMLKFRPKPPFKNGRDRCAVFVADMSDLFGPWVPFDMLDKLFAIFALRPDVDWLLLTKWPERKAEYFSRLDEHDAHALWSTAIGCLLWQREKQDEIDRRVFHYISGAHDHEPDEDELKLFPHGFDGLPDYSEHYPLPNVWLGTSVENQAMADERIPHLLKCPAAVRFLSCEPLLGPLNIAPYLIDKQCPQCHGDGIVNYECCPCSPIGWSILGGESGPGARPCNVDWIRSLVPQLRAAGVPAFVKQLGAHVITDGIQEAGQWWPRQSGELDTGQGHFRKHLVNKKGGDPAEWPEDLRVREMPNTKEVATT